MKSAICVFLACVAVCSAATHAERLKEAPLLGVSEVSAEKVAVATGEDSARFVTFKLRVEGASAVRLYLTDVRLAPGDKLYIYNGDGTRAYGSVETSGATGGGAYTSEPIRGSDVVLEWQTTGEGGDLPFTVEAVEPAELGAETPDSSPAAVDTADRQVRTSLYRGVEVTHEVVDGIAILEGDIVLGPAEDMIPVTGSSSHKGVRSSVGITGARYRWPNGEMPYVITTTITDPSRVAAAISHWNTKLAGTVKMVPRTTEANYVSFVRVTGTTDCTSYVGMLGYGAQSITVSDSCSSGTLIHEIGHAWGLWHEHTREDRDKYVTINSANIRTGQSHNFSINVTTGDDLGPYDYGSIMHYSAYSYTANGLQTITTIPPGIPIGQRSGLSAGDIAGIKTLYPTQEAPAVTYVPVTIAANPIGAYVSVDGVQYTTPAIFSWAAGSTHTLAAPSFTVASTEQSTFVQWSNGGSQTQLFTVPSAATTVAATFVTSYKLTVAQTGLGTITASPVTAGDFYTRLSSVNIGATPAAGYCFGGWSGLVGLTPANTTVTMTNAYSLTANFVPGTVTVSATSVSAPAAGSTALIGVTAPASCQWSAAVQPSASWVTVNSLNNVAGSGSLTVTVAPNTTGVERSAQVTVGHNVIVVTQAAAAAAPAPAIAPAPCTYTVTPGSLWILPGGGSVTVNVTASDSTCEWRAGTAAFLTLAAPTSRTGSATLVYSATANTTGTTRAAFVGIGDKSVYIGQTAQTSTTPAVTTACTYTVTPGSLWIPPGGGTVTVNVTASDSTCQWQAGTAAFLTLSGSTSRTGSAALVYSAAANTTGSARAAFVRIANKSVYIGQTAQ
jgi:hypothetical protein